MGRVERGRPDESSKSAQDSRTRRGTPRHGMVRQRRARRARQLEDIDANRPAGCTGITGHDADASAPTLLVLIILFGPWLLLLRRTGLVIMIDAGHNKGGGGVLGYNARTLKVAARQHRTWCRHMALDVASHSGGLLIILSRSLAPTLGPCWPLLQ